VGEDPEQLEREIERTRAKLGEDLDALEEKVNPKKVAHRSVDRAKEKAVDVKDRVVGAAKEKAAGLAAGAKDKAGSGGSGTSELPVGEDMATGYDRTAAIGSTGNSGATESGSSGGGVGGKVAGLAGTVKEKAATAMEKAGPLAATAREKAAPLAATAKEKAAVRSGLDPQTADTREVATAFAGGTWQTLQDQTRRNPVAVGVVAFLIGIVLGR
jgi:Protein of unknown function (DUF3618)